MNSNQTIFSKKIFWATLSSVIALIVYILTLAPDVYFIDSGEFAAALVQFNICHPTGYPLFTLLGKIFTSIPLENKIYLVNLFTAIISAFSIFTFFYLCEYIIGTLFRADKLSQIMVNILSAGSALIFAFDFTSWNTSNSVEVYSLHKLFLALLLLIFTKAINTKSSRKDTLWILFAFILGLSFGNHMTTIFMSVGCLVYFFSLYGFNKTTFKRILMMAVPFILGLSIYLVLVIRADKAYMSWGLPDNFERFYRHVSGKQFSVWMFSSWDTTVKQFKHFIDIFPKEFAYLPLILALIGLIKIFIKNKKFFWFTLLLFAFNIAYAINYDIYDIDSYFLLSFMVTTIWAAVGLFTISEYVMNKLRDKRLAIAVATGISILMPVIMLAIHYKANDESKNYFVKDYTHNIYNSTKPNSILISSQWDFMVAPSWYYQYVKGERPDLIILDKELMKRGWYIPMIEKNFPELYSRAKTEFDAYNVELQKFEKYTERYLHPKSDFDITELKKIQNTYAELLTAIVKSNSDKNIYVTYEVDANKQEPFATDYFRIPEGLLIRYSKTKDFDNSYKFPEFRYEITNDDEYHYKFLMLAYYSAYTNCAQYLLNNNRPDDAEMLIKKAEELELKSPANFPNAKSTKQLRSKLNQVRGAGQSN